MRMILLVAVAVAVTTVIGCGKGHPDCVPVSGQVLIDGKPVPGGMVRFVPEKGRPATADIQSDGRFTMKTFEEGDGVLPGKHIVTVIATKDISSSKRRWFAPRKYAIPTKSGLTETIDKPNDSLVINLTWKGEPPGKPFDEKIEN